MTTPIAPRIFGIVARKAPIVAIFRRDPSKQVALMEWNLATNRVELGQWLKGRIYERRAGLSPDGRRVIYFAATHRRRDTLGGAWTAFSRMPHLRALHIYGWDHAWNGGGLFNDNKGFWLNEGGHGWQRYESKRCCGQRAVVCGGHPCMRADWVMP